LGVRRGERSWRVRDRACPYDRNGSLDWRDHPGLIMARAFGNNASEYGRAVAVTPSDATDVTGIRALYIGGAGSVVVRMLNGGNTVTLTTPAVGQLLRLPPIDRVMAATAATLLVGYY
jgi:hypothetical protein